MIHTLARRRTPIVVTILLCVSILLSTTLTALFPAHAASESPVSVAAFASVITVKPGQRYHITLIVTGASGHPITLRDTQVDGLVIEQVPASPGTRCAPGSYIACLREAGTHAAQITLGVRAADDRPEASRTRLQVMAAADDQVVRSNPVVVRIHDVPGPAVNQPVPDEPTSTPSVPTDTPCLRAAMAAAIKQGARYSQGGALVDDPINPAPASPHRHPHRAGGRPHAASGTARAWTTLSPARGAAVARLR